MAKFLSDLETCVAPSTLASLGADELDGFLRAKVEELFQPNTVRKWLAMARTFYSWLYEQGAISAETLLSIKAIPMPTGSSATPSLKPYSPY